jgi:hypothetical protein
LEGVAVVAIATPPATSNTLISAPKRRSWQYRCCYTQQHKTTPEGGARWGDVDHASHAFGLAVPTGIISTTGVAGLTLCGGHGYLARKYGLTIDNLLEADVVLADGSLVKASEEENEDLFWAIRGGGGNFGVVTSFLFRAIPLSTVYGGPMLWELDRAEEIMRWYREFSLQASEDLYGFFAFLAVPPGPPFPEHLHNKNMCAVVWCYSGPTEEAEEAFRPIREEVGPAAFEFLGPMPPPRSQQPCRSAAAAGPAVVLAGRLRQRAKRRGHSAAREVRFGTPDAALDHAPLPDKWSGAPGWEERYSLQLPRC